jgi:undecaprenyl-diphosphatase
VGVTAVHSRFPITGFDRHWFSVINGLAGHNSLLDLLGKVFANYGPEIWVFIFLLVWFWPPLEGNRTRRALVYAGAAAVLALAIGYVLSHVLPFRPRPFVYLPPSQVHQLLAHKNDSSFPSDHATGSFAIAVALFYAGRQAGWWALLLAVLIAVGRVFTGLHWPTDVIAGAVIGSLSAAVVLAFGRGALEGLVGLLYRLFGMRPERIRVRGY